MFNVAHLLKLGSYGFVLVGLSVGMLALFRQAEDSGERIRAIVDTVDIGIVTIDEHGIVERFNPAAEQIFGYSASEVTGHNVNKLMPEPYRSEHDAYLDRYMATGETHIIGIGREVEGRRADGTTFPMDLSVSRTQLGDRLMFTGIVRDITERKRVDKMKNEFISTVSHELRTPLTSVVGSLGLVQGGAVGELPEKAAEMINIALNNSNRLVRLVNDILDIEKIESGKMRFRKDIIDVTPLVEHAIQINHPFGAEHGVSVALAGTVPGARLQGDNDLLTQVLTNLLSNAVKFSSPGEAVEVAITRHSDSIRIAVADEGPGIPDTFRPHLFQRFAQADASDSRRQGGTGLGLSICKAIVTRHRGTIDVTSGVGKGSTFFFDIPEWHPEAPTTSPASGGDADPGGGGDGLEGSGEDPRARILHVEDDADTTTVLRTAVGNVAIVISAPTAASATRALTQHEFDLVVLDRILPDGDGIDLIPSLKKADGSPLPVIIFSVKEIPAKLADTVVAAFVKSRTSIAAVADTIRMLVNGGSASPGANQHSHNPE
jgi:PAS domain S-box-containing protein